MALVEGVRYGLASDNNNNPICSSSNPKSNQSYTTTSKSVIFVKLTDSALKAIDDYLKSQHKTGQHPATLQFLGNEGRINIPSSEGSNSRFDFSLSSNADIEGPQGSFECIQQCGSSSLKSMGPVPFKLRIKAKDDVYETTRQRMNALEETRKHDCAKEIKPNGADIGRRVKKKLPRSAIPPITQSQPSNRHPSPNFNSYNNQSKPPQVNKPINGYNPNPPPFHHSSRTNNQPTGNHMSNNHANSNGFNRSPGNVPHGVMPHGNNANKPISGGSITRRPLRDRLIHLLALRNYKKPELTSRLQRDGMSEKDKKLLMPLLSQVTALRNNEYILNRGIWNDIQEDWPFYSEQEKQILKRRKPQNLTPPGSDCSVGSGGSLSSLSPRSSVSNHSGQSPPGYSAKSLGQSGEPFQLPGTKRPPGNDFDLDDNAKRPRISHFKRPNSSSSSSQHHSGSIPTANNSREKDYPYHSPSSIPNRHAPNGHPQRLPNERLSPPGSSSSQNYNRNGPPEIGLSPLSYEYPSYPWQGTKPMDQSGYGAGKLPDDETDSIDSGNGGSSCSSGSGKSDYSNGSLAGNYSGMGKSTPEPSNSPLTNGYLNGSTSVMTKEEPETYEARDEFLPDKIHPVEEPKSSKEKEVKMRGKERSREKEAKKEAKLEKSRERNGGDGSGNKQQSPKYLTTFLPIRTPEQRDRYKAEFNADYKEYMRLHSVIDKVSKLFAHLDERLRQTEHGSHDYHMLKEKIIQEYTSSKSNPEYESARQKFQYLHGKLSHIKRLVVEYDSSHSNSDYGSQGEDNE